MYQLTKYQRLGDFVPDPPAPHTPLRFVYTGLDTLIRFLKICDAIFVSSKVTSFAQQKRCDMQNDGY